MTGIKSGNIYIRFPICLQLHMEICLFTILAFTMNLLWIYFESTRCISLLFSCLFWFQQCGRSDTLSRHSLPDTQWPWHAAIYIRSPPDHPESAHRAGGGTALAQQGASEESTFWFLACSGALVATRCVAGKDRQQPFHTHHVKIVTGGGSPEKPAAPQGKNKARYNLNLRLKTMSTKKNIYIYCL